MKKEKITALLLTLSLSGSMLLGCSSEKSRESETSGSRRDRNNREESSRIDETEENDEFYTEPTTRNPEDIYHVGDHQILIPVEGDFVTDIEWDGEIPDDYDERYVDQPALVELAHEYAQYGKFYDFYNSALEHEYAGDIIYIDGEEYCYIHGFRVEVSNSEYEEERYYVLLTPEELLPVLLEDWGLILEETDYGYHITHAENEDFYHTDDFNVFCYDYYSDSNLLVYHYGTNSSEG